MNCHVNRSATFTSTSTTETPNVMTALNTEMMTSCSLTETKSNLSLNNCVLLKQSFIDTMYNRKKKPTTIRKHKLNNSVTDCSDDMKKDSKRSKIDSSTSSTLDSKMDNLHLIGDFSRICSVPFKDKNTMKLITHKTMREILTSKIKDFNCMIIDCRYPYEYDNGHINNAVNLYNEKLIYEFFFGKRTENTKLIFYCEFSSKRAPKLLSYLRNEDRKINAIKWPCLHYPEMYLLEGGFCDFFNHVDNRKHCTPQSYIEMTDPAYKEERINCQKKENKLVCRSFVSKTTASKKALFSSNN